MFTGKTARYLIHAAARSIAPALVLTMSVNRVWAEAAEMALTMIDVPAGTFTMGRLDGEDETTNDLPRHAVTLSSYGIGRYEVTNGQFCQVLNWALAEGRLTNATGHPYDGGYVYTAGRAILETTSPHIQIHYAGEFIPEVRDGYPMNSWPVIVPWYGAVAFCNWRSEMEGLTPAYDLSNWSLRDADSEAPGIQFHDGYRLPTEAEWERAAAWDTAVARHWVYGYRSDILTGRERCNWRLGGLWDGTFVNPLGLTSEPYTSPVGWFDGQNISPNGNVQTIDSPSPIGCYDMTGNAFEWCQDWYDPAYYASGDTTNPTGPADGTGRTRKVNRGGSYNFWESVCRTAARDSSIPALSHSIIGFRVARSVSCLPPFADANGPYTEWATSWDGAQLQLDGTLSYDPEGGPLAWEWDLNLAHDTDGDGDSANDTDASGPMPVVLFPIGQTDISLAVIDEQGLASDPNVTTVTVSWIGVLVDVKAGSDPNSINLGSHGVVPVAFLTTADFDAATIDPITVTLRGEDFEGFVAVRGRKGTVPMASLEDVDGDGDYDLVLHLETERLAEYELETLMELGALTYDGYVIYGADLVRVVPE